MKCLVRPSLLLLLTAGGLATLSGCAHQAAPPPAQLEGWAGWGMRELPGKRATRYSLAVLEGRRCLLAQAQGSVSLWRRELRMEPGRLGRLEFEWWVKSSAAQAHVATPETDDAPARLVLAFDGDHQRLSGRNRMLFELAQTLTGEMPPYATLMYVWDAGLAPETVVISRRSDRIRMIVVGGARGRWERFERDVVADFSRAFGEAPGDLIGKAFMTDADNTRSRSEACYGRVQLRQAEVPGEGRNELPRS